MTTFIVLFFNAWISSLLMGESSTSKAPDSVCTYRGFFLLIVETENSRTTFDWNAVATLAVWLMTLFIQRANRRDTLALHAKLDELLRVDDNARSELTRLDEEEPEKIEKHRDEEVRKGHIMNR